MGVMHQSGVWGQEDVGILLKRDVIRKNALNTVLKKLEKNKFLKIKNHLRVVFLFPYICNLNFKLQRIMKML